MKLFKLKKRADRMDIAELRDRILKQDRRALARAITLVESGRSDHRAQAAELLDTLRPANRSRADRAVGHAWCR